MGNCSTCACQDKGEVQTYEVQVEQGKKGSARKSASDPYQLAHGGQVSAAAAHSMQGSGFSDDVFRKHVQHIVKLQAIWRGYSSRKLVAFIRQTKRADSKYFTMDESKETVGKGRFDPNAKREKRDTYKFKTGATYLGEWVGGFRDGQGVQIWPDGARYEGQWKDNRAHGVGKFVHVDGDVYDGRWVNDKANGQGVYVHMNGARYEGQWKDGLQHGRGLETWTDGSQYEGFYLAGKKHGEGLYSWNDGSKYDGEWQENKIKGQGVYTWLDGRKYFGDWVDNNMEGMGVYTWHDGRRYEGEYKDDKKHGYGVYTWADGRCYQGWWFKGKQHGLGRYMVPNQSERYGLWEDGKRIEWFEDAQVPSIVRGQLDYKTLFRKTDSQYQTPTETTFNKPSYFDAGISNIRQQFRQHYTPSGHP